MNSAAKVVLTVVIIAIVLVAGVIALGVGGLYFFSAKPVEHHQPARMGSEDGHYSGPDEMRHAVRIDRSALSDYSPKAGDEEVSAEQFIANLHTDGATTLARKTFIESAQGNPVRWRLRVRDVEETDEGRIRGTFELPYWIMEGPHSASGSNVRVEAFFEPEQRSELIRLKAGQWTLVTGRLELSDGDSPDALIQDAEIIEPE